MQVGSIISRIKEIGRIRNRLEDSARNMDDDRTIKVNIEDANEFARLLDAEVARLEQLEIKDE